eukprot:CAMPEP_0119002916 /NCGR_PEP_ID=MMETSP1176-20130426/231_1 /TAXON_ID=265551 /ORGANISM="Synedropsis recta cf, Strain CCMP1620" /LENGTH=64 /DNA_ID=CAMNT_0006954453 /DNA_START=95 /DNA_END=292 /DNA_ORIENTATION=+
MCRKVSCQSCGNATWAGCGLHVTSALQGVNEDERCPNWKGGSGKPCGPIPEGQGGVMSWLGMKK